MNRSRQAWADRLTVVFLMTFFAVGHLAPSLGTFTVAFAVGFAVLLASYFVVGFVKTVSEVDHENRGHER